MARAMQWEAKIFLFYHFLWKWRRHWYKTKYAFNEIGAAVAVVA
jgi:hypothetical protein